MRSSFGPVKRTLESLLKARTQSYYVRGLDSGELDAGNLHRLANANAAPQLQQQARHVFQQKVKARSLEDTACALSIDMSGSMACSNGSSYESKDKLAQKCAIVFAHALEGVQIPFEITAWSTTTHGTSAHMMRKLRKTSSPSSEKVPCTVHTRLKIDKYSCPCCLGNEELVPADLNVAFSLYTRFGGLRILEVKKFDEKWQQVDWRLTHVRGYHANYDGESVLLAARRLMQRKEKRKVLFVLCDGIPGPDYSESSMIHAEYLHEVVHEIRTSTPIELIGVGISAPAASAFYAPQFVNVENTSELPKIVADQLRSILLR